ncbi:hypothetical protein Poly51_48100 [Rubripirellula tenax]|uniref:Uncharacterized protein n=1 Tax=Rubripirellula tenax TaxID=2528015 RepID=A0A5C6EMW9_9BACT|nr:hypothetical protein Poly51_48100 [Rubripirellula tenax]
MQRRPRVELIEVESRSRGTAEPYHYEVLGLTRGVRPLFWILFYIAFGWFVGGVND